MLAIIGGSGLTRLSTLAVAHREVVRTPYGEPSAALVFGEIAGHRAIFLARHGHGHTIPPHRVNYRANLWALKDAGRHARCWPWRRSAASAAALPGDLVLPHQLIDYTSGRAHTFFDGGDQQVVHVDFTHPYSPALARSVPRRRAPRPASRCATAASTAPCRGPRLETAAEIDRMDRDGATLVGMTGMPEAGARARARRRLMRRCASSSIMRRAAATARRACRWKASRTCSKARWTRCAR